MTNPFMQRRRPIGLYLFYIVAGLVAFVVVGLVVQVARMPHHKPDTAQDYRPPAAIPPPGSQTGVGDGPLQEVAGTRQVNDVAVGYPHTTVGAVSAAAEYWSQIASTLDPARAAQIAQAVADPSWKNGVQELAQGPVNTRKGLGLATSGPVPAGASVLLTCAEYQVQQVTADSVTVLLLGYYQTTLPGQNAQNRIGVFPLQMHWAAGDWKMPEPTLSADYHDLETQPGSSEAAALGWQPLSAA